MKIKIFTIIFLLIFPIINIKAQKTSEIQKIIDLYKNKNYSTALEKSLTLLNINKDMSPQDLNLVYYYIGLSYKKTNNLDMSVKYFEMIDVSGKNFDHLKEMYLEMIDIFKDDYFKKEGYLEKLVTKFPKTPEAETAAYELCQNYQKFKNNRKIINLLLILKQQRADLSLKPEFDLFLMVAYERIDDYIEALDYYNAAQISAVKILNRIPLYLFTAGKVLFFNQNFKESIKLLNKYTNKFPKDKNFFQGNVFLAKSFEKEKNYKSSSFFLISALEKKPDSNQRYELLLILGRSLTKLSEEERNTLSPKFNNPKRILTRVKDNSSNYSETREATILLNDELLKEKDFETVIDNYYEFLLKKRDKVIVNLFKKNLNRYIQYLQNKEEYEYLFQLWVNLKDRKSFLSDQILVKLAENLYKSNLFLNADEVYSHILSYQLYKKYWDIARVQHARILFQIGHYQEFLSYIKEIDKKILPINYEFDYLKALAIKRFDPPKLKEFLNGLQIKRNINKFTFSILLMKAVTQKDEQKFDQSFEILQNLYINPVGGISQFKKGTLLINLADLYYSRENFQKALTLYSEAEKYKFSLDWILYRQIKCSKSLKINSKEFEDKLTKNHPNSFWTKEFLKK